MDPYLALKVVFIAQTREAEGIRDLTLDANKIEQMLKYRKSSFAKSVSTTFVTDCSLQWRLMWSNIIKRRLMSLNKH